MLIIGCDFHSRYQQITMAGDRAKDLNQPSVLPWFSASPARVGACGEFFFPRLSTFNFRLSTVQPTPAAVQPSISPVPCKTLNKLISACYSCPVFVATRPRRSLDSFSGLTPTPCPLSPNSFPCHTSENSPVSPIIATLPKMRVSNPCVCHTYDTPRGSWVSPTFGFSDAHFAFRTHQRDLRTSQRVSDLSPVCSHSCTLFCTHQKHNSFIFKRFRTLCEKHPGWGKGRSGIPNEEL